MKVKVDGKDVDVMDRACPFRECFWMRRDYGSFSVGRGYTSYHEDERWNCGRRNDKGCPDVIPEPSFDKMKCCDSPSILPHSGRPRYPSKKKCKGCGAWIRGLLLKNLIDKENSKK